MRHFIGNPFKKLQIMSNKCKHRNEKKERNNPHMHLCLFSFIYPFKLTSGKRSERDRGDKVSLFHLSASFAQNGLLVIQIYMALEPLHMAAVGDHSHGESLGPRDRTSYFTALCASLQSVRPSFRIPIRAEQLVEERRVKKSIHISIIHSPVCLHLFPRPLLPWGKLTPPPRSTAYNCHYAPQQ